MQSCFNFKTSAKCTFVDEHYSAFPYNTHFEKFVLDQTTIIEIFNNNETFTELPKGLIDKDLHNNTLVLFLAPFATSAVYELTSNVESNNNEAQIYIEIKENDIALAVLNQKFWIGKFSKGCDKFLTDYTEE